MQDRTVMRLSTLVLTILVGPWLADAQGPTKVPRLGMLFQGSHGPSPGPALQAFLQRLHNLGYHEGENLRIDYRFAAQQLDRFVAPLDQPMYVLTVAGTDGGHPSGCLVGFATQCSIAPPRLLACLSKENHTYRAAASASVAAVHRLAASDHDLAALFGEQTGDEIDKFARCAWTSPRLFQ